MTVVVHLSYLGKYYSLLVDFSITCICFLKIFAKPSYKISSYNLRPDTYKKVRGGLELEPGCTLQQMSPYVTTESSSSVHFGYYCIKLSWKTRNNLFQPQMTTEYT